MANYNMGDTLERALTSVLEQLDEDFEVFVVDDGSTDDSVVILEKLAKQHSLLRFITLQRDRKRQLGETWNFSIRQARGDYVLLHIDADDVWAPYLKDFVAVFHRLETCLGRDILLSGQQVKIGKRSFLMEHGPYRNLHRCQDRDLWRRLAAIDAYIPLNHRIFRNRLSRPRKAKLSRGIRNSWFTVLFDLKTGTQKASYVGKTLTGLFRKGNPRFTLKGRLFRAVIVIPAYIVSRFQEPLTYPENMKRYASFVAYRERTRGTYAEIMTRHGCDPDLSWLRPEAQEVFKDKTVNWL